MKLARRAYHRTWPEAYIKRGLSPRMALATRLYATAAVPTKAAAADAAGVSRGAFYVMTSGAAGNEDVEALCRDIDAKLQDRSVDIGLLTEALSQEAIRKIGELMKYGTKEEIQLRAAMELADRGKRTAKITKHEVTNQDRIDPASAKHIAEALVAAAEARKRFGGASAGNYDRVGDISGMTTVEVLPADE